MLKSALQVGLTGLFLIMDGIVYWLVSILFSLYAALAGAEIIKETFFDEMINRIYVVIGVFMLFVVAYSLLKALINPDNLAKDTGKVVTNIIISLFLIGIVPTIFNYARDLQNIIVEENIIGNLIFDDTSNTIEKAGNDIAFQVLSAFLEVDDSVEGDSPSINAQLSNASGTAVATWGDLKKGIESGAESNFMNIAYFAEPIHEGVNANYIPIISAICGAFLAYVILSFCLDLGIRVFKFAFYQIIAPIPILLRIIPEKKSVFDNWLKASIATYVEVFIRLFIILLLAKLSVEIFHGDVLQLNNTSSNLGLFGKVIVVLGLFAFAKQAPKLIGDVIGVDSSNIKLGIGGKLQASGALGLAAMLGGATTTGIRNFTHGFENSTNKWATFKNSKGQGFRARADALGKAMGTTFLDTIKSPFRAPSVAAGIFSGAARSAKAGFSAKTYADTIKAASEGATAAVNARDKREAYKASHTGTTLGAAVGRVGDAISSIKTFAGLNASADALKKTLDIYQQGFDFKEKLENLALKKSTQAKVYEQQIDALNQAAIKREDYKTDAAYHAALVQRAADIDQLKNAKNFAVMKEISERLGNLGDVKNAEFAEIVNSFQTFKKQNANLLSGIADLTNAGWDSAWDSYDPMSITKDFLDDMKEKVTYTSNHEEFEKSKNETAKKYAEFIQKENEKK